MQYSESTSIGLSLTSAARRRRGTERGKAAHLRNELHYQLDECQLQKSFAIEKFVTGNLVTGKSFLNAPAAVLSNILDSVMPSFSVRGTAMPTSLSPSPT